jgi:hypothetical protein
MGNARLLERIVSYLKSEAIDLDEYQVIKEEII